MLLRRFDQAAPPHTPTGHWKGHLATDTIAWQIEQLVRSESPQVMPA